MFVNGRVLIVIVALVASASSAYGQDRQPPAPAPAQKDDAADSGFRKYLKHFLDADQGGGFHVNRHLAAVFGGIKPGSGVAAGAALSAETPDGGYAQLKGVYSVRDFKLVQGRFDTPHFWGHRALFVTRVRWQDAPRIGLYELGPDSPRQRGEYGEQKSEVRTELDVHVTKRIRAGAGLGLERYTITAGDINPGEDQRLPAVPDEPGLGAHPWFTHGFLSAAIDTRPQPYATTGRVLDGQVDDYRDWNGGTYAFQRAEAGVEQLIPVASRNAVDLSARMWASVAGRGHFVPFFLLPTLGGGDYLQAYNVYRFRDLDAAWIKAEYRHAVHPMLDVIGFYELGTVAGRPRGLSFANGIASIGAGVLAHTTTAPLSRITVAHGRDGFHFTIVFIAAGG